LSCSAVNVVVIFVSFLFWELHICWVVLLTVNPSIYVEHITFCVSEWLAAFSFVISFHFLVSFDDAVQTVTQMWCKVQQHASCNVGSEHNVALVIQCFLHEPSTRFFASVFHSGE
jgi:hypothetical protein